jgi:hypothetical protein
MNSTQSQSLKEIQYLLNLKLKARLARVFMRIACRAGEINFSRTVEKLRLNLKQSEDLAARRMTQTAVMGAR